MKYLLILLFIMGCTTAVGQTTANKRVVCLDTESLIRNLIGRDYEEQPVWLGVNEQNSTFSLFINKETLTWTIIEFKGKTACILGAGSDSQISRDIGR